MAPKAPRIPDSVWERYRGEIIALYCAPKGTLPKTMQTMKERYDFEATKNQYTLKLKTWGLEKNANNTFYLFADQRQRKRKLQEGKDTEFGFYGRKRSRYEMDKEIARHVTLTNRLQLLEDIPTPEGVEVFTPEAENHSASVALRDVFINDLPFFQLQRGIQALMLQFVNNPTFQFFSFFNTLCQLGIQLDFQHRPRSAVQSLQMALGDVVQADDALQSNSSNEMSGVTIHDVWTNQKKSLSSYLPMPDNNNAVMDLPSTFDIPDMPSQVVALEHFLKYFIFLTNNNVIRKGLVSKGVDWLLGNVNAPLFSYLFTLDSTAIRKFMRKILPHVVKSGNIRIAKEILRRRIDAANLPSSYWHSGTLGEECMAVAIENGDNQMVELLCKAGFLTQIARSAHSSVDWPYEDIDTNYMPWRSGNNEILRTLLFFHTDPECLVKHTERGFPLVDAARWGNLEAVNMLLNKGCDVNAYVLPYFGTPLQAAVCSDNLEMVRYLIARGADLNAPYGTDCHMSLHRLRPRYKVDMCEEMGFKTPIQIACEKNSIPLIGMLLARGALVDVCPLSEVIIDHSIYKVLLRTKHSLGCSPNYKAFRFQTALQYSVQNRDLALVHWLLSKGANPDTRSIPTWGDTPLQMSIRLGFTEIAEALMRNGADVNASPGEFNGRTAVQAAAESGNIQIAQVLLNRNANINAPGAYRKGLTALQAAIKHGHPVMAGYLMMSGANVNAPPAPKEGLTAIHAVAEMGDLNMIKNLIRQGADVKGIVASSAISVAISRKDLPMLKFFIELTSGTNNELSNNDDADAEAEEEEEEETIPPIVASARSRWVDGVRYLLEMGADVNASSCDPNDTYVEEGYNSLSWSIINQDHEMLEFLLERGADLDNGFSDKSCNDALCLALYNRCSRETILLLLDKYTESDSIPFSQHVLAEALHVFDNDEYVFHIILQAISKNPNALYEATIRNAWNRLLSYRHCFDEEFTIKVTGILLKAGAKMNTRSDPYGGTLLQRAMSSKYMTMAIYLIGEGADICVPATQYIGTPLQEAIEFPELEITYILLKRGAHVNASPAPEFGVTALQAAAKHGYKDLAVDLLERGADVNALPAEEGGVTALQAAAIQGHIGIAIELLRHGAHVAAAGAVLNGRTAIEGAAERGLEDMLQLLLNHYDGGEDLVAVCEGAAIFAEKEEHVEIAQWLREYPKACL